MCYFYISSQDTPLRMEAAYLPLLILTGKHISDHTCWTIQPNYIGFTYTIMKGGHIIWNYTFIVYPLIAIRSHYYPHFNIVQILDLTPLRDRVIFVMVKAVRVHIQIFNLNFYNHEWSLHVLFYHLPSKYQVILILFSQHYSCILVWAQIIFYTMYASIFSI